MSLTLGFSAEKKALTYLKKHGLKHLSSNYRCPFGEVDLIMRDINTIVFVEVRYRTSDAFGTPDATVDENKLHKITLTAESYLQKHQLADKYPCRIDVVSIANNQISWIKNAIDSL